MARSQRVKLRDLSAAFRLIHEARDVGHDPSAWPVVIVNGLAKLLDARTVAMTRASFPADGSPGLAEGWADVGWDSPEVQAEWFRRFNTLRGFRTCPMIGSLISQAGRLTTRTRDQVMPDAEWYRCEHYNSLYRPFGIDQLLLSYARDGDPTIRLGFGIDRHQDGQPFGARERRLVRFFHRELLGHLDRNLVRPSFRSPLPPRLKRTLDCLLEGDTAGQAALRMGLSRHTVNEYIQELYRHFGVRNRPELMAHCLRDPRHRPDPHSARPASI